MTDKKPEPLTKGFAQFGLPSLALQLLVLLIICSNLALANRVYSGQANSRITDYPNCAKPVTLCEMHYQFQYHYIFVSFRLKIIISAKSLYYFWL